MSKNGSKIIAPVVIVFYVAATITYHACLSIAKNNGFDLRLWVEMVHRIILWGIPAIFIGYLLLILFLRFRSRHEKFKWLLNLLMALCVLAAAGIVCLWFLISMITVPSEEKMPDGNLVIGVPDGMETIWHYAEPVGIIFRKDFEFDDEKLAESLSKIYALHFTVTQGKDGNRIFVASEFPEIEVRIIRQGYQTYSYLDTNLELMLASDLLFKHKDIFEKENISIESYALQYNPNPRNGVTSDIPYFGVMIDEENKESAAKAIAEFIKVSIRDDKRNDGVGCWDNLTGKILLLKEDENGQIQSFRSIPFSKTPEHWWTFDENVTYEDVLKDIDQGL